MIGNYVPRRCGIATFTADLTTALNTHTGPECWALAMNDRPEGYDYPREVRFEISQNEPADYRLAADYLNIKSPDAVSLQHEYGIYGGESGSYIINLLKNLRMPVVSTLHTVLQEPTRDQRKVLLTIAELSSRLVVMSKKSRELLMSVYGVPEEKIRFVHHGIPDMPFVKTSVYKKRFGVQSKKVILTFGLLSPNKGIEVMIKALPAIVEKNPDAVYIVVGATHPHVKLHSGEEYRQGLERLARKLGVEKNIIFYNRFVEFSELCDFLGATDVYVTPYLHAAQAVSGTLAYAMGAGKPVVSTPYWYAEEMLADERGVLVGFNDSTALSESINRLLADDKLRGKIVKKAWDFSRGALWKNVAAEYLSIFDEIRTERQEQPRVWTFPEPLEKTRTSLPDINLGHLFTMTDDTGILQHATYSVPEYAHGYCIDDNARALIVSVMAALQSPEPRQLVELQRSIFHSSSTPGMRRPAGSGTSWVLTGTGLRRKAPKTVRAEPSGPSVSVRPCPGTRVAPRSRPGSFIRPCRSMRPCPIPVPSRLRSSAFTPTSRAFPAIRKFAVFGACSPTACIPSSPKRSTLPGPGSRTPFRTRMPRFPRRSSSPGNGKSGRS